MRYRNDVIRSVLLNIRAKFSKMLARDYESCHAVSSTLVMLVANTVQQLRWSEESLDLNPITHLLDILKFKVPAVQPLMLNFRTLSIVIHQMCAAIPQQYNHKNSLPMSTRHLAVVFTYDVIWFLSFCFKGVLVTI